MSAGFVHLRVHTEYSIIDSILRIKPLMKTLAEQNMNAVGVAESMNFFSAVKVYQAAMAQGIKPLLGVDLNCVFAEQSHDESLLSLICQNEQGYLKATEWVSKAYLEGQIQGKPYFFYDWMTNAETSGLIALSGARRGLIGQALLNGNYEQAKSWAQWLAQRFPQRFYLEIQRLGHPNEAQDNARLIQLANELQLPLVATNEPRFIQASDYEAHEARCCIHEGCTLADQANAKRYTRQQFMRSSEQMRALFKDLPHALENTVQIARRCTVELKLGIPSLPTFPAPDGRSEADYLEHLAQEGLEERLVQLFQDRAPEYRAQYGERLALELSVIRNMGFPGYFLIVADFIGWAKTHGVPVGPGRGSGAGSLVAYALKITDLDPIAYDLLFERFLNPERVSMPDFDVDFCMEGRDRVIDYVTQKYGRNSVSQIITFGTMAAKAVVRDVGRVLAHPYGFVDKLAKLIPFELGMTLEKAFQDNPELKLRYDDEEEVKELFDLAFTLEGLTRNVGKHAGGVVIAPSALTDFTAVYCESGSNQLVSQFDKDDVEAAGLVKFDFLGLRTLTIIDWAVKTINQSRVHEQQDLVQIEHIPMDCPKTFQLLKACQTTAVFQLESRGMKELIHRLQPDSFEEIIALVALFRPGPLQSGMVDDFINRKHGRARVEYPHPDLEPILQATYGVILYQEQVMQIAQVLANYTLGAADLLRRAMGKKKPEEMAKQRTIFIEGAQGRGIDESISGPIFDLMEKFAGYGFNKSHSAAYALISYQTSWLKAHYPAAFMAAVLSSDMDNTDKVVTFIDDANSMKLTLLPPCIEQSSYRFTVTSRSEIRYGLGAIKGVGEAAIEVIESVRPSQGFGDLFEFCRLVDLRKVNRRVIEALIKSGAMDAWGSDRAQYLSDLEQAIAYAEQCTQNQGQMDLFSGSMNGVRERQTMVAPMPIRLKLTFEKETLGFYLSGHPVTAYRQEFGDGLNLIRALNPARDKKARLCVLLKAQRTVVTKRGKTLVIVSLEDASGKMDALILPEVFERVHASLVVGEVLVVEGEISLDDYTGQAKMLIQSVYTVAQARSLYTQGLMLTLAPDAHERLSVLHAVLKSSPGVSEVRVRYCNEEACGTWLFGPQWKVTVSDDLLTRLKLILGEHHVEIYHEPSA